MQPRRGADQVGHRGLVAQLTIQTNRMPCGATAWLPLRNKHHITMQLSGQMIRNRAANDDASDNDMLRSAEVWCQPSGRSVLRDSDFPSPYLYFANFGNFFLLLRHAITISTGWLCSAPAMLFGNSSSTTSVAFTGKGFITIGPTMSNLLLSARISGRCDRCIII